METYSKTGVEIFSVGKWNGDEYTAKDLADMCDAFNELKSGMQPYLKLGHSEKQALLQADGLPAAGWIDKVYVRGNKLVADFVDIPKKVYELIKSKAYKKVSAEIFWNFTVNNKKYRRVLGAVALLGADTPGVGNLSDILAMYKLDDSEDHDLKVYDTNNTLELESSEIKEEKNMSDKKSENEIKLEYSLEKTQKELADLKEKQDADKAAKEAADKELADLKKFKAEAEVREQKAREEAEALKIKNFVTQLKADKLCSPAMEELVTELLGSDKKEYSVKLDKEDKKLSKEELLKETLKLFKAAAAVNFDESSSGGDKGSKQNNADMIDKKAKEYMAKDATMTYGQAVKAAQKEMQMK